MMIPQEKLLLCAVISASTFIFTACSRSTTTLPIDLSVESSAKENMGQHLDLLRLNGEKLILFYSSQRKGHPSISSYSIYLDKKSPQSGSADMMAIVLTDHRIKADYVLIADEYRNVYAAYVAIEGKPNMRKLKILSHNDSRVVCDEYLYQWVGDLESGRGKRDKYIYSEN